MEQQNISVNNLNLVISAFKNDSVRISFQDCDGNILYVSKKISEEFGHIDANLLKMQHFSILQGLSSEDDLNIVYTAHKKVIKGEENALIIYSSHANSFYFLSNTPVWGKNGNVLAEQSVYCPILAQTAQQLYRTHYYSTGKSSDSAHPNFYQKKLTQLQESIIFLLVAGKTQQEAAEILGYSRSNIAKNIVILCSHFEIESKEKSLIDFCLKNGYDKFIPKQLLQRKIIEI